MKIRMVSSLAIGMVLVAGMAASTAFAHEHDKMMGGAGMMDAMDTNHDGMISADEHAAHAKMMFDKMDANHDGMVNKAEMDAGMKMMHEEREHMKKDGDEMKEDMDEKKEEMNEKK